MSSGSEGSGGSGADEPLVAPLETGDSEASAGSSTGGGGASAPYSPPPAEPATRTESPNMLPRRERNRPLPERLLVRLIATCGIVGIGVAIAAIMVSSNSKGWIVGLVVSIVSVILAAILWSSRTL